MGRGIGSITIEFPLSVEKVGVLSIGNHSIRQSYYSQEMRESIPIVRHFACHV